MTTYSTLEWSADGALVTKTRTPALDARRRFRNELRTNQLLRGYRGPVRTPALVAFDVQHRRLIFTAVQGDPLGPKYPTELSVDSIDAVAELAQGLRGFNPERRWLRRFNAERRLALARRVGLLTDSQVADLLDVAVRARRKLRFSHGDLTARNVLCGPNGMVLIDWEWAGLYPDGYDLAFLWFSLVDVKHGRERVEKHLGTSAEPTFLLCALLIQLWHLQWYVPVRFRDRHLATRDELIERLCG